jgi:beta-glucanase (GH16 family)
VATTTTTSPPVIAAPPPDDDCAGAPPDIGGNWTCTFDDEFNGTSLDTSKWTVQQTSNSGYYTGYKNDCYVDNPANVSVANGVLSLTAIAQAPFTCVDPDGDYSSDETSGMVSTDYHFNQTYGLFEVRAAFPSATVPGLQSTLWLWPQNSRAYGPIWPDSGEIDFAEWYSEYANLDIPVIHYNDGLVGDDHATADCALSDPSSFHTYGVEWTPASLTILLDGAVCMVWPEARPEPFNLPFFVVLTQALGVSDNAFNPRSTPLPATTRIDWVRVWK